MVYRSFLGQSQECTPRNNLTLFPVHVQTQIHAKHFYNIMRGGGGYLHHGPNTIFTQGTVVYLV
jgi:hypothetical protein